MARFSKKIDIEKAEIYGLLKQKKLKIVELAKTTGYNPDSIRCALEAEMMSPEMHKTIMEVLQ